VFAHLAVVAAQLHEGEVKAADVSSMFPGRNCPQQQHDENTRCQMVVEPARTQYMVSAGSRANLRHIISLLVSFSMLVSLPYLAMSVFGCRERVLFQQHTKRTDR
jgi:hypothetical protein